LTLGCDRNKVVARARARTRETTGTVPNVRECACHRAPVNQSPHQSAQPRQPVSAVRFCLAGYGNRDRSNVAADCSRRSNCKLVIIAMIYRYHFFSVTAFRGIDPDDAL